MNFPEYSKKHPKSLSANPLNINLHFSRKSGLYRYSFNGQETEGDITDANTHTSAEFWMYDTRLGRRWEIDPLFRLKPWLSPYHAFSDKPIVNIDPNGALDTRYETEEGELILDTNDGNDGIVTIDKQKENEFRTEINRGPLDKNSQINNANWITKYASSMAIPETTATCSNEKLEIDLWAMTAFFAGSASSVLEQSTGSFRVFTKNGSALSPKYYPNGWSGGSTSHIRTFNISKIGKAISVSVIVFEITSDVLGVVDYYSKNPTDDAVHPGKAAFNLGMTIYGSYVNPYVAAAYGALEVFYPGGAIGFMGDGNDSQEMVRGVTKNHGNSSRLIPFGPK